MEAGETAAGGKKERENTMKKKVIAMLCAAAISACLLVPAPAAQAAAADGSLRILFTHDLHDHILPWQTGKDGKVSPVGGYAYLKSAIDRYRTDTSVTVDAGDFSMGTLFNGIFETDAPDLTLCGKMGYDAVTLGNHEFDYGPEALANSLLAAKDPPKVLSSNIHFADKADSRALKTAFEKIGGSATTMVEKNGVKIGLFGLMGKNATEDIAYPGSVTFTDQVTAAQQCVSKLQAQGADVIICLSHSGTAEKRSDSEDVQLAKKVKGIDVIISGHSHTLLPKPIVEGNTTIVSCGCYGQYLGVLDLDLKTGRQLHYELVPITQAFAPDQAVKAQIEGYEQDVNKQFLSRYGLKFDDVIAESPLDFDDVNSNFNEFRDSNMGDLVADAHAYAYQKTGKAGRAVGIAAKGIIRAALYKGELSLNDVYSVTSVGQGMDGTIGDPLALVYLNGGELWQTCELVATLGGGDTQMYFSGMRFSYMNARPIGDRVVSVELQSEDGSWAVIDKSRLYPVVCNLYVAQMLPVITRKTHHLFTIVPKDAKGNPTTDYAAMTLHESSGEELKDWTGFVEYLQSFPKNENGVAVIPERYQAARATKTALPFRLTSYFSNTSKLGAIVYAAAALVIALAVFFIHRGKKKRKAKKTAVSAEQD